MPGDNIEFTLVIDMTENNAPQDGVDALIASRICHDLVNPMGAVMNGIELLAMDLGDGSPELELLKDSSEATVGLIKRFRLMFGQAAENNNVSPVDLTEIVEGFKTHRISLSIQQSETIDRVFAKSFCLALNCIVDGVPLGGDIEISIATNTIRIRSQSERLKPAALWDQLAAVDPIKAEPAQIHFALLQRQKNSGEVTYELSSDKNSQTIQLRTVP